MIRSSLKSPIVVLVLGLLATQTLGWRVKTTKDVYGVKQAIVVQFQNLPGNQNDWITIAPAYSPADKKGQYATTLGQRNGQMYFLPQKQGVYEARVFFDWPNGEYMIKDQYTFTVSPCAKGCNKCKENYCSESLPGFYLDVKNIAQSCHSLCGNCSGAGQKSCTSCAPGRVLSDTDNSCFAANKGLLLLDKPRSGNGPQFAANEKITILFSGFSGSKGDWITITEATTPDDDPTAYRQFLGGMKDGKLYIEQGLVPGDYEARGYYDFPHGGFKVQARVKFTVGCAVNCLKCTQTQCTQSVAGTFINGYSQPDVCHPTCKTCANGSSDSDCLSCVNSFILKDGVCNDPAEQPKVWTEKTKYKAFEPIVVQYRNLVVSKEDWVALSKKGDRDSEFKSWKQVLFRRGTITFEDGLPPGSYEAKVHRDWPEGSFEVFSRYPFEVTCFQNCDQCKGSECVKPSIGFYLDYVNKDLQKCDQTCRTCYKSGPLGCSSCYEGNIWVNRKSCVADPNAQNSSSMLTEIKDFEEGQNKVVVQPLEKQKQSQKLASKQLKQMKKEKLAQSA